MGLCSGPVIVLACGSWEPNYVNYAKLKSLLSRAKAEGRSMVGTPETAPSATVHLTMSLAGAGRAPTNPVNAIVEALEEVCFFFFGFCHGIFVSLLHAAWHLVPARVRRNLGLHFTFIFLTS